MADENLEYLENLEDPRTQSWLQEQADRSREYFGSVPQRAKIRKRMSELMDYPKIGIPWMRGPFIYYFSNQGLQNQSVVCRRPLSEGAETIILDPVDFAKDGKVSVVGLRLSEDCRYLAFGISRFGSDWQEWRIRDLKTLCDLPESLKQIRSGVVSWAMDGSGFYYTITRDEVATGEEGTSPNQTVMFHRIGTDQTSDQKVFECPSNENWTLIAKVSDDGKHLLIFAYESANDQNRIWVKSISDPTKTLTTVVSDFAYYYVLFASRDGKLWFRSNENAPRGQILEIDVSDPTKICRRTIVTESTGTIERASIIDNTLIVAYLEHACTNVKLFNLDGTERAVANVPQFGSLSGFEGLPTQQQCFFSFSSFNTPQTIYEFDVQANESRIFWKNRLSFDPDDYTTRQVFVDCEPGIKVPMFISHRRDLDTTVPHPCYLYSYGGFGFCHKPFFSTANLQWMEDGGIFCLANVRGGGEYGQSWHDAGRLKNKKNTFCDFLACAEWLIERKLTLPNLLAAGGRSNGGLTIAAAVLQKPQLFRAAIVAVGVLDLLRFHKLTVGWAWKAEYGDPDNADDRALLLSYSPIHRVKKNESYPAFLISTADHDDRVHPSHSFKFAKVLQDENSHPSTKLLRVELQVGHGQGRPLSGYIEEVSDFLAFLHREIRDVGKNP